MGSDQQRAALAEANKVLAERRNMLARVKNGSLPVAFLVMNNPKCLHTLTIGALLQKQKSWGRKRMLRFLLRLQIGENREIIELTWRQRNEIADTLGNKGVDWTREMR